MPKTSKTIQLSHGGGGQEMTNLVKNLFFSEFDNPILRSEEDAALLELNGCNAFTTDSFTVSPLFFAGANIGKLAVTGTVNDLSMMGAKPEYLSCSFIIEEGFELDKLTKIVHSMAEEANHCGAKIVCGDTKVVPKGCADGMFINTSGIGKIQMDGISVKNIQPGDAIIVSRDIGRHGAAILMARESLTLDTTLTSDCSILWPVIEQLITAKLDIHAMRDATRGGLSAVLNEWAVASNVGIMANEDAIPVCDEVQGLCELYGFEPYDLANEGTFILALPYSDAIKALEIMHTFVNCGEATIIGTVSDNRPQKVILKTLSGGSRFLDLPQGELLPRIC